MLLFCDIFTNTFIFYVIIFYLTIAQFFILFYLFFCPHHAAPEEMRIPTLITCK